MTRKKSDKDNAQHLDLHSESIDLFTNDPSTIEKKRRLAYIRAVYLIEYLEEQGKIVYRFPA